MAIQNDPLRPVEQLSITKEQRVFADQLLRDFRRLGDDEKAALKAQLQVEDVRLEAAIQHAKELLEAGKVSEVEARGKPIGIDEAAQKLSWGEDSWQLKLLRALDGAGYFEKDGKIMASELVTGLRSPDSPQFLTTASVDRLQNLIAQGQGADAAGAVIDAIKLGWMKDLAAAADLAGNADKKVSQAELKSLLDTHPELYNKMALQNVGVMLHQIAELTGEPDPYRMIARGTDLSVVRSSYVGSYDAPRMVSTVIAQTVTATDLKQRGDLDRTDNFHADELLPKFMAARPEDYRKTGYDMGHLAASADATTLANVSASFSLLNMAPQLPDLNRFSWRYLEASVRDLIVATGARAVVYTGNLFLDAAGNPLPPDSPQLQTIGKPPHKVAVPTHCFKSVLFQFPGGKYTTMSFIIENKKGLPTDVPGCKRVIQEGRATIADIERLAGVKLFEGMLPESAAEMKADKTSTVPLAEGQKLAAADFLWGANPNPKIWNVGMTPYEVDATLKVVNDAMRLIHPGGFPEVAGLDQLKAALKDAKHVVSRSDVKKIVLAVDVQQLSPQECKEAHELLADALLRVNDTRGKAPLQALIKRIEARLAEQP